MKVQIILLRLLLLLMLAHFARDAYLKFNDVNNYEGEKIKHKITQFNLWTADYVPALEINPESVLWGT